MDLRRWYKFCIINVFLLLCKDEITLSGYVCERGLNFPGYTVPQGDIIKKYGDRLEITCVLNDTFNTPNASRLLSFRRNNETIPAEMIKIVNSTAIKLEIENPPKVTSDHYACTFDNNKTVCMNFVSVGIEPQKVTDFDCMGYNFEYLICTWTAPENYVRTTYDLTYNVASRSARMNQKCPHIKYPDSDSADRKMSCFWNTSTTPYYRKVHDSHYFNLTMRNVFGTNIIYKEFHHFAHVLPGPPKNLTLINSTTNSLFIYWEIPHSMETFPPGVHHRILYNCEFDETKKLKLGALITKNANDSKKYFDLTGLKHAYSYCDIKISLRSAEALATDEKMWSKNATITVQTKSKVPDRPPITNVGSFEIIATGNILQYREAYIYWQQIHENEKNGPNFTYRITVEGDELMHPVELQNAYAKFTKLLLSTSYSFHIWSENINGTSENKATLFIPKQTDKVKEPISFTKVEFGNGKYELTWEAPNLKQGQVISNYTIFWCNNQRDRPYQCEGQLSWKTVPSNTTTTEVKNLDKNKIFQFAISANTHNSTSGMLWAACNIIHNNHMGKIKNVWISKRESTSIEVQWKLECSDRIGNVEGYIIYYCPIKSMVNTECTGPQMNVTFVGSNTYRGTVMNLVPYRPFMFTVAAIIKHSTFSQQSDPLYNFTLQAAPSSPPQDLSVLDITNSSILLSWMPPSQMNGELTRYEIYYNDKFKNVTDSTNVTLDNLEANTNYSISLIACTVQCSNRSQSFNVTTKMGYPSQIQKPTVDRRNDTSITIVWSKPLQPRGKNDYYVVSFKQKLERENKTLEYNVTKRKYVIGNCGDGGKYNTFYVSVRAINIIEGKLWPGPWSEELENYCETSVNYIMFILIVVVIIFFVAMAFLFNRLWHHCKKMRDVEVKLPPGLAPVIAADHWNTNLHKEKTETDSQPDEEMLLMKMSESKLYHSGDSSGCSSGHESVTSSLESGSHGRSSSDSGTEQAGNYCVLGDGPPESSPYVMTGEPVKTVNLGYISVDQTGQMGKSPTETFTKSPAGYVVAGTKNSNGYLSNITFNQPEPVRSTGYVVAGVKNFKLD